MKNNGDNLILGCEEMNDNKYPYIGESTIADKVVLFVSDSVGTVIEDGAMFHDWDETLFTNITREYLFNTKIKALSEEHSEMIQKLAFNAGYKWMLGEPIVRVGLKYLSIYEDGDITGGDDIRFSNHAHREIFLPMPESKTELEEKPLWSIGDEVDFPSGRGVLVLNEPDDGGIVVVKSDDPDFGLVYKRVSIHSLSKPKAEQDILKQALIDHIVDGNYLDENFAEMLINEILEQFNVTEKGD